MATIDSKGRVVLTADVRARAGIEPGAEVDISVDGQAVRIVSMTPRCVVCGRRRDLVRVREDCEAAMCEDCITAANTALAAP